MKGSAFWRATPGLAAGLAALGIGAAGIATACSESGTCPAKVAIVPDASCSDDQLQCAYDLSTPSLACDGTEAVIPSSCVCSAGAWSCPAPIVCTGDAGATTDGATEADAAAADAGTSG